MAGDEATMPKRKLLCKMPLKILAKLIKRIKGKIIRENKIVYVKRVGVAASFGNKKEIIESAQISNAVISGIKITAKKAKAVIMKEICCCAARFLISVNIGTKDELKAPSARTLRKKEGILMARSKASVSTPTPKKCEISLSRTYPRIRLMEVKKPTQKVSLKNCMRANNHIHHSVSGRYLQ